jgi:hypothetical protein
VPDISNMRSRLDEPICLLFLVLPYGISSGFISIMLPFVLTRAGFSVALGASIVGHRRVGKSLAISLGPGGGSDSNGAPLVFVRPSPR